MKQSIEKEKKIFMAEIVGGVALLIGVIILAYILSFKKRYTITFDSMGGTHTTSTRVWADQKIKQPLNPTKNGYTFLGWYYKNTKFNFDETITSNMKLVARWEKNDEQEDFSIKKIIKGIQKGQAIIDRKIPR